MTENYLSKVCDKLSISSEAKKCFISAEINLKKNQEIFDKFLENVELFSNDMKACLRDRIPEIDIIAEKIGIHKFTLHFIFAVYCSFYTKQMYFEKGLDESLFWDGMMDLSYKLKECVEVFGVYGIFVLDWYEGFLHCGRFTLGRFQYEPCGLYEGEDKKLECGYILKKNTRFISFHIPSSGESLTDEVRNASYEKAYYYFKDWVGSDTVLLDCHSWLLFPDNRKILPPSSNVLKFLDDFEIYKENYEQQFSDAWRVFGKSYSLPVENWPEETSMQRGYKKWILEGNSTGNGNGFIVLKDGKNVTHIKDFYKD